MTKRSGAFDVKVDLSSLMMNEKVEKKQRNPLTIDKALQTVIRQMRVSGFRPRTMSDYERHMSHLKKVTGVKYVEDIATDTLYEWLDSMDVSNATKLIRLKCMKAILGKFMDNGWIEMKFWKSINVKVSKNVKKGSTVDDINILLSLLDMNTFIGLRDTVAILTLFKTGIRINTLGQLQEKHIDFNEMVLNLDGSILKNHNFLKLPIDEQMVKLLQILIMQNEKVRNHHNQENDFIFISQKGTSLKTKSTNNAISKRLHYYSKRYELENINPHAIRRGFAKNLLNKGANLPLISKALGHSDFAVTTQYLNLESEEVASSLRDFL